MLGGACSRASRGAFLYKINKRPSATLVSELFSITVDIQHAPSLTPSLMRAGLERRAVRQRAECYGTSASRDAGPGQRPTPYSCSTPPGVPQPLECPLLPAVLLLSV